MDRDVLGMTGSCSLCERAVGMHEALGMMTKLRADLSESESRPLEARLCWVSATDCLIQNKSLIKPSSDS